MKCNITKSFQKFIEILTALHFPGAGEVGRHFELRIVLLCLLLWSLAALVLLFYSLCDRPLPFCLMFSLTLSLPSRLSRLSLRLSPAHWQHCRLTVQTAASSNLFQHHPLMFPSHPSAVNHSVLWVCLWFRYGMHHCIPILMCPVIRDALKLWFLALVFVWERFSAGCPTAVQLQICIEPVFILLLSQLILCQSLTSLQKPYASWVFLKYLKTS